MRKLTSFGGFRLRRFARREDGSAAVEFALVATPFFALLFAIIETALVFFAGQALESASADSARLILTGQAQSQGLTASTFKDAVCAKIVALIDCKNGVYVDVKKYSAFASIDTAKPIDADGNFKSDVTFQPGGPCEIVVVRLMYQLPIHVSLLSFNLSDTNGGNLLLIATSVFRNEPYQGSCT